MNINSPFWRSCPGTARAILSTLLFLAITACSVAPSVNVVFPVPAEPSAAEPPPEANAPDIQNPESVESEEPYAAPKAEQARRPRPVTRAKHAGAGEDNQPGPVPAATPPAENRHTGSAAYYIPKQMVEKQASLVDLWIDRTVTVEQLKRELATKLRVTADRIRMRTVTDTDTEHGTPSVPAQLEGATIPIGGTMIAQLRGGNDFDIEPEGPIPQSLQNIDRAKWNWRVTPRHAAEKGMLLDLDIWIDPGPGRHLIDSYHESVIVAAIPIPWYEKLYNMAQGLNAWLALLGIGGIGGLLTWIRKKKTG